MQPAGPVAPDPQCPLTQLPTTINKAVTPLQTPTIILSGQNNIFKKKESRFSTIMQPADQSIHFVFNYHLLLLNSSWRCPPRARQTPKRRHWRWRLDSPGTSSYLPVLGSLLAFGITAGTPADFTRAAFTVGMVGSGRPGEPKAASVTYLPARTGGATNSASSPR